MRGRFPIRFSRGIPRPSPSLRQPIPCILLLEDEDSVRAVLAEALARGGYGVLAGSGLEDGKEALAKAGWKNIDLVVADTHLSREHGLRNGYAFQAWWKARHPIPPFIFMDGWGGTAPPRDGSSQVYTLAKPFPLPVLLGLVRAILGR